MSSLGAVVVALIAFGLVPALTAGRWGERASPRLLASAQVVGLLGWGTLPAAWLACIGSGIAALATTSGGPLGSGCWLGVGVGEWRLAGYGLAGIGLAPLVWQAARVLVASHRAELRGLALAAAERRRLTSGDSVWVLPADELVATAGGVLRPKAVVTTAVLARLSPKERQAVLEHEAAHIRLGHPRLLIFGVIIARAYGFLPPVRRTWAGLRRELEATADAEAVRHVDRSSVLSALVRVGLSQAGVGASFADPEHIRYRLRRLEASPSGQAPASAVMVALSAALLVVLAWSVCAILDPGLSPPALATCVVIGGALALRPIWSGHLLKERGSSPT